MEVIYRKSIIEKMQEAIEDARRKRKDIEVIRLTREEWDELECALNGPCAYKARRQVLLGEQKVNLFMGVRLEKDFEDF